MALLASNVLSINVKTKRILLGSVANTSLKLNRLEANPACIAGVLTSCPHFSVQLNLYGGIYYRQIEDRHNFLKYIGNKFIVNNELGVSNQQFMAEAPTYCCR
jgi:hypothetical protein